MMQLNKILVLVESESLPHAKNAWRGLDRVMRLAMEFGAEITVCDVLAAVPADCRNDPTAQTLFKLRESRARERLETLCAPVAGIIPLEIKLLSGVSFLEVTRMVLRDGIDLVVHLTDASNRYAGLEANDMHLVRKCPSPVWVMDMSSDRNYENIVVAVDRDIYASDSGALTFAMQLAQTALMFARLEDAKVHIVHAWQPFGADFLDHTFGGLSENEVQQYLNTQQDNHTSWLDGLYRKVTAATGNIVVDNLEKHLIEGPPASAVPAAVEALKADLLVMGTLGVTNVPGLFIGNTAENILTRVEVPVLALKPPGFDSPVKLVADGAATLNAAGAS